MTQRKYCYWLINYMSLKITDLWHLHSLLLTLVNSSLHKEIPTSMWISNITNCQVRFLDFNHSMDKAK